MWTWNKLSNNDLIIINLVSPGGILEALLMTLWQSPANYIGCALYSVTWWKTGLSITGYYLPTSSVCPFFLLALCLAGRFLPGLMILSHVHTTYQFSFLHNAKQAVMWPKGLNYSFSDFCIRCSKPFGSISSRDLHYIPWGQ